MPDLNFGISYPYGFIIIIILMSILFFRLLYDTMRVVCNFGER